MALANAAPLDHRLVNRIRFFCDEFDAGEVVGVVFFEILASGHGFDVAPA
jgi:hypothetical protein